MKFRIRPKNIVVILLTVYVCYIFVNQQITMWNIEQQINNKQVEKQKMEQENVKLQDEVKMSKSDMYIEKLARERLGFIKQGETPVINVKN